MRIFLIAWLSFMAGCWVNPKTNDSSKEEPLTSEKETEAVKISGVRVGNPVDPGSTGDADPKIQAENATPGLFLACDQTPNNSTSSDKGVRCAIYDKDTMEVADIEPQQVEWSYDINNHPPGLIFDMFKTTLDQTCSFMDFIRDISKVIIEGITMSDKAKPAIEGVLRNDSIDFKLGSPLYIFGWSEILKNMNIQYKITMENGTVIQAKSTPFGDYVHPNCPIPFNSQIAGLGTLYKPGCMISNDPGCFIHKVTLQSCQYCNKPDVGFTRFIGLVPCSSAAP